MLPEVTARVGPPRALSVSYPLGYPLGAPNNAELQREILRASLALCGRSDVPLIEPYRAA
jgi:D-proline reductase (dithiol) PrdB